MSNKEKIEDIARKLEQFNLYDITIIAELDDNEVNSILKELVKENRLIFRNERYYYIQPKKEKNTKKKEKEVKAEDDFIPIDITKSKDFQAFLELPASSQEKVKEYVKGLNLIRNCPRREALAILKISKTKYSFGTLDAKRSKYRSFGLKGIFPCPNRNIHDTKSKLIYEKFKKYYLNNNQLNANDAYKLAVEELEREYNITFPYFAYTNLMLKKLKNEYSNKTINMLRKVIDSKDKSDINIKTRKEYRRKNRTKFKDAAEIYINKIKKEHKLEKHINLKTSYENHIADYFDNFEIDDITTDTLKEYKLKLFNQGYSLASVQAYVMAVKDIIRNSSPDKKDFGKKFPATSALNFITVRTLSIPAIKRCLDLVKRDFNEFYPIVKLGFTSGASIPEIFGLKWKDIDLDNKTFRVRRFKYLDRIVHYHTPSETRTLQLDTEVVEILKNLKTENSDTKDFVFDIRTEIPAQVYFEKYILKEIAKIGKIKTFTIDNFVHNYVNIMLIQKVPLSYIKRQCGTKRAGDFEKLYDKLIRKYEKPFYRAFEK